jgi:hypothetical protein
MPGTLVQDQEGISVAILSQEKEHRGNPPQIAIRTERKSFRRLLTKPVLNKTDQRCGC